MPGKGGEPVEQEVFKFEGAGGVGLAMYNTDEVRSSRFKNTTSAAFLLRENRACIP